MTTLKNFQPLPSSLYIFLAKFVFNSVSNIKLISEMHDVCCCQAKKKKTFFPSKDSAQPHHFVLQKEEFASYPVLVLLLRLSFYAGH
jgi:hypothetical protein